MCWRRPFWTKVKRIPAGATSFWAFGTGYPRTGSPPSTPFPAVPGCAPPGASQTALSTSCAPTPPRIRDWKAPVRSLTSASRGAPWRKWSSWITPWATRPSPSPARWSCTSGTPITIPPGTGPPVRSTVALLPHPTLYRRGGGPGASGSTGRRPGIPGLAGPGLPMSLPGATAIFQLEEAVRWEDLSPLELEPQLQGREDLSLVCYQFSFCHPGGVLSPEHAAGLSPGGGELLLPGKFHGLLL